MTALFNYGWILFLVALTSSSIDGVSAAWPPSNSSRVQLLGLFRDRPNISDSIPTTLHSQAMFRAAVILSQQYNILVNGQFLDWQAALTGGDIMNALDNTCEAISLSNVVGIVGPPLSREAHIIAPFAKTIGIPVVSYSATDPDLASRNTYPAFYRTVPSDTAATRSIAQLFLRFNWTSSIVIYQNDQFGSGGVKALSQTFLSNGLTVTEMIEFDITTARIRGDLRTKLSGSSTRIVIVWAEALYTTLIVQSALANDLVGPQFTWILGQSIALSAFNKTDYPKLIGMLTVEPTIGTVVDAPINTTLLNAAYALWQQYEPQSFPGATRVNQYALFAFDATWSLIQALSKLCSITSVNDSCITLNGPSYCFDRRLLNSSSLFDIMSSTTFLGVSGLIQFSTAVTDRVQGSYYLAQNIQPAPTGVNYVPILERSDPGDWKVYARANVILWPGNTLTAPTGRAVLAGVRLRIGIIESVPFTSVATVIDQFGQNYTKYVGYVPDVISLLQGRMKFIPDIMLAPSNQTYAGLIQAVANGVYDIVVGDVTITSLRREIVGFSNAIFDSSQRIIVRKEPAADVDLLSYLKPFSINLWMMLLAACVCAAILVCLLERQHNVALQHRTLLSSAAMSMWYSIGTIMGYGADFHATTAAGRIITIGLYILSLVFVATYTANLASDLTVSKSKNIISGIDDIKNGKVPFSRFGIRVGTVGEEYYLREISGGNRNFFPLKSRKDLYEKLLNKAIDASFMDAGVAEYVTNNVYCNLTLVGVDFDKSSFGIVIPKQWLYAQDLDVNILALRESGVLDDLKRKWFQSSVCADATEKPPGMGFETLSGLFLTFAIMCILSLLFFVWDKRSDLKDLFLKLAGRKTFTVPQMMTVTRRHTLAS